MNYEPLGNENMKETSSYVKENTFTEQSFNKIQAHVNKTITIGLLGISRGVGVTHTAIMLAQMLSKKNKIALIELNDNRHFEEIGRLTQGDGFLEQKGFVYNKIHYFWDLPFGQFITRHREQFDFVILDLGDDQQLRDMDEFVRADIRIVVGHGMDWKLKEVSTFNQKTRVYDPNDKWNYIIPFMDKKAITEVRALVNCKVFPLPYNMNPFIPSQEVKKVFETVMSDRK